MERANTALAYFRSQFRHSIAYAKAVISWFEPNFLTSSPENGYTSLRASKDTGDLENVSMILLYNGIDLFYKAAKSLFPSNPLSHPTNGNSIIHISPLTNNERILISEVVFWDLEV